MAIRQYVGARYVPRFTGLHNATQIYDALDVVDNGAGTSYIAKKTVPAGTPLTDTEYWFVYGASSGAIISLQNRMDTAENDIDTLEGQMTNANGEISNLKKMNIVLISDSYGNPAFSGGMSWLDYVTSDMSGRTITPYWEGGAGFGWDPTDPLYFPTFFDTFTQDNNVDMVLILTGANDGNLLYLNQTTEAGITSGMVDGITKLKAKFPNAVIHLGFVGRYKQPARYLSYKQARDIYRKVAESNGIFFADNFEYVLHVRSLLDNGDIHPTLLGQRKIANYAVKYILTGHIDVNEEYESPDTVGNIAANFRVHHIIHNGVSIIQPNFGGGNSGSIALHDQNVPATGVTVVFNNDFASETFNPMAVQEAVANGIFTILDSPGGSPTDTIPTTAMLYFLNGKMALQMYKKYNTNGGYYSAFLGAMPTIVCDTMDC